jgi:hypothetical protein
MKTIIALISAMLITTPALAGPRHHDHYRIQKHHHHNNGKWVAPLIGGVVLGAIIADANAKQKEKENARKIVVVREPQQHCEELTIIVQNRWGDVLERRTEYRCTEY